MLKNPSTGAAVLVAALALPGVVPTARAESAPESAQIGFKYLNYRDSQPGLKRVAVDAPSVSLLLPVAGSWSLAGSYTLDSVSGASPRWHSSISSASKMSDFRRAADLRVTRYFARSTFSFGTAYSTEHDYRSNSYSLQATFSSDDNNTTWAFGIGRALDRIDPVNGIVVDEHKRTTDLMIGVTQVLTPNDIVQANLTLARGRGYYSDPYKQVDQRPRERNQSALMLRWNHHFDGLGASLRTSYRHYDDSFDVKAHTMSVEWAQPLPRGWTIAPSIRYHTQSAARFYYDPVYDPLLGAPFPPGYLADPTGFYSADHRLSAFGALTLGIKVSKAIAKDWNADFRYEIYEQRNTWRIGGTGSPGIAPFRARFMQVGVTHKF
ncbi:MAG TPA: DUF3570 domain-containing protein [Burkholderiaceae bacterium]|jgi:hypothetical protein|nr:DUF3570 domain-containing protein [Burkholderiaceae bacterium]HRA79573.1 DUF3570 domain-containing protein [Burkholderiaceae bacterium]